MGLESAADANAKSVNPPEPTPRRWDWNKFHSRAGNWAQIISALIAIVGFTAVVWQLQIGERKSAEEAFRAELGDARRNYNAYTASLLQYPELGTPNFDELLRNHREYLRYKSFVSHMIYAYDDILNVVKDSPEAGAYKEWVLAFKADVEDHRRYFCQLPEQYFDMYRPNIKTLLYQTIGACTPNEKEQLKELQPAALIPIND